MAKFNRDHMDEAFDTVAKKYGLSTDVRDMMQYELYTALNSFQGDDASREKQLEDWSKKYNETSERPGIDPTVKHNVWAQGQGALFAADVFRETDRLAAHADQVQAQANKKQHEQTGNPTDLASEEFLPKLDPKLFNRGEAQYILNHVRTAYENDGKKGLKQLEANAANEKSAYEHATTPADREKHAKAYNSNMAVKAVFARDMDIFTARDIDHKDDIGANKFNSTDAVTAYITGHEGGLLDPAAPPVAKAPEHKAGTQIAQNTAKPVAPKAPVVKADAGQPHDKHFHIIGQAQADTLHPGTHPFKPTPPKVDSHKVDTHGTKPVGPKNPVVTAPPPPPKVDTHKVGTHETKPVDQTKPEAQADDGKIHVHGSLSATMSQDAHLMELVKGEMKNVPDDAKNHRAAFALAMIVAKVNKLSNAGEVSEGQKLVRPTDDQVKTEIGALEKANTVLHDGFAGFGQGWKDYQQHVDTYGVVPPPTPTPKPDTKTVEAGNPNRRPTGTDRDRA